VQGRGAAGGTTRDKTYHSSSQGEERKGGDIFGCGISGQKVFEESVKRVAQGLTGQEKVLKAEEEHEMGRRGRNTKRKLSANGVKNSRNKI